MQYLKLTDNEKRGKRSNLTETIFIGIKFGKLREFQLISWKLIQIKSLVNFQFVKLGKYNSSENFYFLKGAIKSLVSLVNAFFKPFSTNIPLLQPLKPEVLQVEYQLKMCQSRTRSYSNEQNIFLVKFIKFNSREICEIGFFAKINSCKNKIKQIEDFL